MNAIVFAAGRLDEVVHRGRHHQPAGTGAVHQRRPAFAHFVVHRLERLDQQRRHPRIVRRGGLVFVGDEFGLHGDAHVLVEGFDDVLDGGQADALVRSVDEQAVPVFCVRRAIEYWQFGED